MTSPSAILSRAADLIRDTAAETTKPRKAYLGWGYLDEDEIGGDPANGTVIVSSGWGGPDCVAERVRWGDARWIALMSPAVADWQEQILRNRASLIQWADSWDQVADIPERHLAEHVIAVLGEKGGDR